MPISTLQGARLAKGIIQFAGAATPGWISNLGMTYATGVFTITGANGKPLSASNPGYVAVRSAVTPGKIVNLKITAPFLFKDDSHASSDLTGQEWTSTTRASSTNAFPFWIFVVNRADSNLDGADGSSTFGIAFEPLGVSDKTPSSALFLGDTDAIPSNDAGRDIILLGSYTEANYVSLPLTLVGCFRMLYTLGTTDWTVQTLSGDSGDGFGTDALHRMSHQLFTYAVGEVTAGQICEGATAPIFSTESLQFQVNPFTGIVTYYLRCSGDAGQDGSGGATLNIGVPYNTPTALSTQAEQSGPVVINYNAGGSTASVFVRSGGGSRGAVQLYTAADAAMTDGDFTSSSARYIKGTFSLRSFQRTS